MPRRRFNRVRLIKSTEYLAGSVVLWEAVFTLGAFAVGYFFGFRGIPLIALIILAISCGWVLAPVGLLIHKLWFRRTMREVRKARGMVCAWCMYPLDGGMAKNKLPCPECGEPNCSQSPAKWASVFSPREQAEWLSRK